MPIHAKDAFQATFLALSKKAGSIQAGPFNWWILPVAVNAALKLRASRPDGPVRKWNRQAISGDPYTHEELACWIMPAPVVLCSLKVTSPKTQPEMWDGWHIGKASRPGHKSMNQTAPPERSARQCLPRSVQVIPRGQTPTVLMESSAVRHRSFL